MPRRGSVRAISAGTRLGCLRTGCGSCACAQGVLLTLFDPGALLARCQIARVREKIRGFRGGRWSLVTCSSCVGYCESRPSFIVRIVRMDPDNPVPSCGRVFGRSGCRSMRSFRSIRLSRNRGRNAISSVGCQAHRGTQFSRTFDYRFCLVRNEPVLRGGPACWAVKCLGWWELEAGEFVWGARDRSFEPR